MSSSLTFQQRLIGVLVPTSVQLLAVSLLSLALLLFAQSNVILPRIGVTSAGISASTDQFHDRFDAILRSSLASHIALMTFWALVGLVAYLICWGAYNALIEARNEVTLNTAYTNRGHWRGPFETLAVKSLSGVGLAVLLNTFWSTAAIWMALSSPAISEPSVNNSVAAILGVLGLALQLYVVLVFIQLTFTPWYRAESFTNA